MNDATQRTEGNGAAAAAAALPAAAALAAAAIGLFAWNADSDRLQGSPALEALLGREVDGVGGWRELLQLVHEDDRTQLLTRIRQALAAPGRRFEACFRLRRGDGSEAWLLARGASAGGRGAARQLSGALLDIGALKEGERQLLQSHQLDSSGLLAGGIANDFAHLLGAMVDEVQRAQRSLPPDSPAQGGIAACLAAAARGQQLARRLLEFARRQDLRLSHFAADLLLLGLESKLRQTLGPHITLQLQLEPPTGSMRADRSQIEAVLLQLAANARQAMPRGGTFTLSLDQLKLRPGQSPPHLGVGAGKWVRIRAGDDGIGMDAAVRARVFEPFFTTNVDAKGLGLSTCHGIVRQLGGHIWVDSRPGQGSTFTLLLPHGEQLIERPPALRDDSTEVRLLLVDDDDALRTVLAGALRAEGFQVLAAASGREALELAERLPDSIDVLIADLALPGIGGTALAARLQRRRPGIRVLYVTAQRERAIELLDQHETAAVLAKPFCAADLIARVRELLPARGQQPAS